MHEGLQKVFDALPLKCNKVFIAGGAAADFDKANDVDVWIPNNSIVAGIQLFDDIHLPKIAYYKSLEAKYKGDKEQDFTLIGEFYLESVGKMVQIIVARGTITQILNRFDLSVHQIAYTRDGMSHHSMYWTTTKMPIEFVRLNKATYGRYIKLCSRYGLKVDPDKLSLYWPDYTNILLPEEEESPAEQINSLDTLAYSYYSTYGSVGEVSAPAAQYQYIKPDPTSSWAVQDTSAIELKLADNMKQAKVKMMNYILYGEDPKSGKSEK